MRKIFISALERIIQLGIIVITFGAFIIMSALVTKHVIGMNTYGYIYFALSAGLLALACFVILNELDITKEEDEDEFKFRHYFLQCILICIVATVIMPIIIGIAITILNFLLIIISKILV